MKYFLHHVSSDSSIRYEKFAIKDENGKHLCNLILEEDSSCNGVVRLEEVDESAATMEKFFSREHVMAVCLTKICELVTENSEFYSEAFYDEDGNSIAHEISAS